MKYYFILCPSYHGATIFAAVMNNHHEIFSLADTYPSNKYDQTCGCGKKVSTCSFWINIKSNINSQRYSHLDSILPTSPEETMNTFNKMFFAILPFSLKRKIISKKRKKLFHEDFLLFIKSLNLDKTDSTVYLDGVKSPNRALYLSEYQNISIVHLYREPAYYLRSSIKNYNSYTLKLLYYVYNCFRYIFIHRKIKKLKKTFKYMSVNYEDFCDNTDNEIKKIFSFLEVEKIESNNVLKRNKLWHFMGNSSVFKFNGKLKTKKYDINFVEKGVSWILSFLTK